MTSLFSFLKLILSGISLLITQVRDFLPGPPFQYTETISYQAFPIVYISDGKGTNQWHPQGVVPIVPGLLGPILSNSKVSL